MRISWNQPIQSEGRYLATSIGSENGHYYLQSVATGRSADASRFLSVGTVSQNPAAADRRLHPSMRDTALLKRPQQAREWKNQKSAPEPLLPSCARQFSTPAGEVTAVLQELTSQGCQRNLDFSPVAEEAKGEATVWAPCVSRGSASRQPKWWGKF
jgi:hypothetical protein